MAVKELSIKKFVESLSAEQAFVLSGLENFEQLKTDCLEKLRALTAEEKEMLGVNTREKFFDYVSKGKTL